MTRGERWGWITAGAVAAVLLQVLIASWTTSARAQGGGNVTFTTSTTSHTTCTLPGGGTAGSQQCPSEGCCPAGTTPQVTGTNTSVTSTTQVGPGTTMIGECQSQTFFVAAGTTNINTNTHTETFVTCLATGPSAIPTLSPLALLAAALLFGSLGMWYLSRHRRLT